ncbi:MAG: 50S ribosomal protein L29 [Acidobacteriota bacterium]|nr:50S ribosomal protein L29 [Acidobacteriota bacterium]
MKASKLRDMTIEEVDREVENLREQIFRLRFQAGSGETENPVKIRMVRRDLARALTIRHQKDTVAQAAGGNS